ncbi:allophanate hydrolase subunit 1 [Cognatishimia sp. F0-27]|uniref:5-oxoprolinase subunit B family protein n=1 Tax=Cognatishimia sp. F0-27 TaxID=2816855 RepID=UPI001D0CCDA6|nr:carboxyltransferase domain-containing protein [Cognatishimia sp. F0-27]MCC1493647.1 allophanate hydrolase subunit 1 [Cognatishimia sp. F0-27]
MTASASLEDGFPRIENVGLDGVLVRFGDSLNEPANRAALALRAALESDPVAGTLEVSTSLVSTFLRFDPLAVTPDALAEALRARLMGRDWFAAPLPEGRRRIRIPTVYDTAFAPQFEEAAAEAGVSPDAARKALSEAEVRVTAIGFAPGQPYLGTLPERWDIPRQTGLTPQVPAGALVLAIRQFVLFSVAAPTGWRHVGQTAATLFDRSRDEPFLLRPGDLVQFPAVAPETFANMRAAGQDGIEMEAVS